MSEVKLYDADALDQTIWRELQSLSRDAFASTLDRSQVEIDTLVAWDDPAVFYASHADPNSQVGQRYNAHQSYSKPRVAVALEWGELVGYGYSAHNVSGNTERDLLLKRLSVVKNYLWLREVAVKPDNQRQGIALEIGKALLKDALPLQPPTAYVWPEENDFLQHVLERAGFAVTGEQYVKPFGEDSSPVRELRLQAKSAHKVLTQL